MKPKLQKLHSLLILPQTLLRKFLQLFAISPHVSPRFDAMCPQHSLVCIPRTVCVKIVNIHEAINDNTMAPCPAELLCPGAMYGNPVIVFHNSTFVYVYLYHNIPW